MAIIAVMPKSKGAPQRDARRFGALIHIMRTERKWTLAAFGRHAHMSAQYLGQLERGENMPSLACVLNLAEVFGVDAGDLVREVAAGRKPPFNPVVPSLPPPEPAE